MTDVKEYIDKTSNNSKEILIRFICADNTYIIIPSSVLSTQSEFVKNLQTCEVENKMVDIYVDYANVYMVLDILSCNSTWNNQVPKHLNLTVYLKFLNQMLYSTNATKEFVNAYLKNAQVLGLTESSEKIILENYIAYPNLFIDSLKYIKYILSKKLKDYINAVDMNHIDRDIASSVVKLFK